VSVSSAVSSEVVRATSVETVQTQTVASLNTTLVAQIVADIPLGSKLAPATNCSVIQQAGMADGYYYVGTATTGVSQVYCRRGVQLVYWFPFSTYGMNPPFAYWSFDNTLTEHINNFNVTLGAGTTQYTAGRIGNGHLFNGATWYSVKLPQ
jgi:hypothetical protein